MASRNHLHDVTISDGEVELTGILSVPSSPKGIVIFAHGSGSGRLSPRNLMVARMLNRNGMITLLLDLLTPEESRNHHYAFDIPLLARRLMLATHWVRKLEAFRGLAMGYFGASTGAAAALWAAAELQDEISAVVSRGGRPDLAIPRLSEVSAPTLLLVGSRDEDVIPVNQDAMEYMNGIVNLIIVPGASHLFEERGTLEMVANEASIWFVRYLSKRAQASNHAWL